MDIVEQVGPDSQINSPAKVPRCWCNKSSAVLRFLAVKVPRPPSCCERFLSLQGGFFLGGKLHEHRT